MRGYSLECSNFCYAYHSFTQLDRMRVQTANCFALGTTAWMHFAAAALII